MEPFVAGTLLGPYRIEGVLGAGGMGKVYKAVDTRLNRSVAIKTSDDRFTERFALEARAISALNHPHICTLYDVGQNYLVMELIEGETLAERLRAGPIALDEALSIAAQIADALEAAHEQGIIHRDLKPANVRITPSGAVKVLDFGLAKIVRRDAPSVTGELTRAGMVLGTSGYMAPEQIAGHAVDKRADIWAFGVVLHEMLTGERPLGSDPSRALDTGREAGSAAQRIPRRVQKLLKSCLAADPRNRLRDIGDFRLLLEEEPASGKAGAPTRRALAAALVGAATATALGAWGWLRSPVLARQVAGASALYRNATGGGSCVTAKRVVAPSLALSPDGRSLVVAATGSEGQRLYIRKIDELVATPLAGTAGAASPFFSPDGAWIGFFADGRLRRVPAEGGAAVDIAEAVGAAVGASWGEDGRIVFAFGWRSPLWAVPASGGRAEIIAPLDAERGETYMRQPELLPGGRAVLLAQHSQDGTVVVAIDLQSGRRVTLTEGSAPRYAQSGHLLVARGTTLLAAPFDAQTLTLSGPLVPLVEGIAFEAGGTLHYAVSPSGTLAYVPGAERYALALVDIEGAEQRVLDEQARFHRPRFAPDGKTLAVAVARGAEHTGDDIWLYDLANSRPGRRLTLEGGSAPIWAPDGTAIAFAADAFWTKRQPPGLYTKNADGRGAEQRLLDLTQFHRTVAWTQQGLVFELTTDDGAFWIELLAGGERQRLVEGVNARLSPDQRWLAYCSDTSGRNEVHVTAFPEGGARWQVAEGNDPTWSPDAAELFYARDDRLMAAKLDTSSGVRVVSQRVVQSSFAIARVR